MKVIVVDLDQTLLHTDKTLSEYTKSVFEKLHKNENYKVVVATGRSIMRSKEIAESIFAEAIITLNGAKTFHHEKVVSEYKIDSDETLELIRTLLNVPSVTLTITYPDLICINDKNIKTNEYIQYSDFEKINTNEIQKMSFHVHDLSKLNLIEQIDFEAAECKLIRNSEINYFTVLNKNVSKLTGLMDLCEEMNVSLSDVITFGDDFNDLDILKASGISVAVANAAEEIKNSVRECCDSNDEDGVAKWLEENLEKWEK